MSNGLNKVLIIGNLGADPEIKYTQAGSPVANLSVATSERWKDKNTGEQKEQVEWHRVVIFGRLAEIAEQYLKKGSKVLLKESFKRETGKIQKVKKVHTEVVAREMTMLDSKGDSMESSSSTSSSSKPDNDKFEEDIPF